MSARQPTVLFDVVEVLAELLGRVSWPALLAASGEVLNVPGPQVVFGEIFAEPARETVVVTGAVGDDSQSTWPEKGLNSKREEFTTTLVVVTNVPNRPALLAWRRMRDIVGTIDSVLRDMTTGRPLVPESLAVLGVFTWWVDSVVTALYPATDGGFFCSADVAIGVKADL